MIVRHGDWNWGDINECGRVAENLSFIAQRLGGGVGEAWEITTLHTAPGGNRIARGGRGGVERPKRGWDENGRNYGAPGKSALGRSTPNTSQQRQIDTVLEKLYARTPFRGQR